MELKFQYNKTALNDLKKKLQLRQTALPILKNKETALRQEVKNTLASIRGLRNQLKEILERQKAFDKFWQEFPWIIEIEKINFSVKTIIGVRVPEIDGIKFRIREVSWFNQPAWIPTGIEVLKDILQLRVEIQLAEEQLNRIYNARKKTTQKVNLYEKVQIPMMERAILKIKRFLEDEENISKAAQKIVKKRNKQKGIMT